MLERTTPTDLSSRIFQYCEAHTSPPSPLLYELERETHLKTLAPQMMSGRLQGQLLALLSRLKRPQTILEIGTFTGYATLHLVEGLQPGGILHTVEPNRELEYLIRKYIAKAGREDDIRLHIGRIEEVLPRLTDDFDLVFMDAGKRDYAHHYELVIDRVRPGGLILADNVLWAGKVATEAADADTGAIRAFNDRIRRDGRVRQILLPLRDGLLIMEKT